MMESQCKTCGARGSVDYECGDAVCTNCSTVLEQGYFVSEVQFQENAQGGSSALGHFIASDAISTRPVFMLNGFQAPRESREITLRKAKKRIDALAQELRLTSFATDTAFNFFKLAHHKGLTRGRKSDHVTGACVYMTCRSEQTAHMLIDVSDALQMDVYELGRTYLRLSSVLCINLPIIDPSIYIWRFSCKLELGDKTHAVSETALRLVKRMKRDWMHTGRRPSGICGAALVIAARLHNFNRTLGDVIKVVKVHESTLRKRLLEFGETPSSALTIDEFMKVDLEEEQDPPAFREAREREKEQIQHLVDQQDNFESELTELNQEIEKHLKERQKLRGIWAKYAKEVELAAKTQQESLIQQFITQETLKTINDYISKDSSDSHMPQYLQGMRPSAASLGIKESIEECMEIRPSEPQPEESGELDLTGIDDDEIDSYILSSSEVMAKTEMWMKINADYLEEMKEKEEKFLKEAKEREEEGNPPQKRKRGKKKSTNGNTPANTAGEAIMNVVNKLKLSNKINYEVLRNLNRDDEELKKAYDPPVQTKLNPVETPKGIASVMESLLGGRRDGSDDESVDEEETNDYNPKKRIRIDSYSSVDSSDKPEEQVYSEEEEEEEEEDESDTEECSTVELMQRWKANETCNDFDDESDDYD